MADLGREIEVHEIELDEVDAPAPRREADREEPVTTPEREKVGVP